MYDVAAEIARLSDRRQELWVSGEDPVEVARIAKKLENLYEEKRINAAKERTGTPAGTSRKEWRSKIGKQARIESELDRLTNR